MDYSYRNNRNRKKKIRRYRRFVAMLAVVFTAGVLATGYGLVHLWSEKKEISGKETDFQSVERKEEKKDSTESPIRVITEVEEETESSSSLVKQEETEELASSDKVLAKKPKDLVAFSAKEADKYYKGAAFIGDSRTQGLQINAGIRSPKFFAGRGLNVKNALTEKVVKGKKNNNLTVVEALEEGKYQKIYISFGINELGWTNLDIFIQRYKELIEKVMEKQPDADIVVYGILPITQKKSDKDNIFNMKNVKKFNKRIKKMAKDMKITYVDISKAVANEKGYLPDDVTPDGIHMNKEYCRRILAYIVNKEI